MKKRLLSLLLALVMLVGMIPSTSLTAFAAVMSVTGIEVTGDGYYFRPSTNDYIINDFDVSMLSGTSKFDPDSYNTNSLYPDEACTTRLNTEPKLGETYYFNVSVRKADTTNNITNSNSNIKISGFYGGKVLSTETTDGGRFYCVCSIKYGELTGGVKAVASGVEYDSAEGGYAPNFTTLKAVSTEGKELEHTMVDGEYSYYGAKSGCLYKTNKGTSFSNMLTTEPQEGETYYSYFLLDSIDGNLNIEEDLVDIQIPGYEVEYLASYERDMGFTSLVVYSATKKAPPVKITGLKVSGNSYEFIANNCHIDDHSATLVTEKGELKPYAYSALFTDAECENVLKTVPEAGKTYYMFFKFNPNYVDYKDAITAANTSIDVKGYTDGKFVKTDIRASNIDVYISLKYADPAAAKPKLVEITFTSDGIRQDSSLGTYFPANPSLYTWSDMGMVDMNEEISCFYTDSACSQQLKAAPTVGMTYYFTITLNHEAGAFENAITSANSSIKMEGFSDCKLVSAKSKDNRSVLVLCSGKYMGDQRKLLGIELTATGVRHDTSLGVYFPSISKLDCKTELGSIHLGYLISRLHKDSACTQDLKTAPEDGQTYYFTVILKHAEGEYENAITNGKSSIQITGFSDCKVVKAEAKPGYGTIVYCSVTYGLVGDTDQDEDVDIDDAIYLLQHVLMPEMFLVSQPTDFDKSGVVDIDDAIYLLQHVLMPEMFPL